MWLEHRYLQPQECILAGLSPIWCLVLQLTQLLSGYNIVVVVEGIARDIYTYIGCTYVQTWGGTVGTMLDVR